MKKHSPLVTVKVNDKNSWLVLEIKTSFDLEYQLFYFQLENKIFIVGGYCWSARRCIKVIQTYEPEKDDWERVGNLPRGLAGLRLCTLTLPHHLVR